MIEWATRVYVYKGANFRKSGIVRSRVHTGNGLFLEIEFFSAKGVLSGKRDLVNASYCRTIQ